MDLKFLDFEQPIAELEAKIEELRFVGDDSEININEEVARLRDKSESLTRSIFSKLSAWQVAQVARHPSRPYTLDYLSTIAPDFQELHGDRMYADDPAIVGGVGRIDGRGRLKKFAKSCPGIGKAPGGEFHLKCVQSLMNTLSLLWVHAFCLWKKIARDWRAILNPLQIEFGL